MSYVPHSKPLPLIPEHPPHPLHRSTVPPTSPLVHAPVPQPIPHPPPDPGLFRPNSVRPVTARPVQIQHAPSPPVSSRTTSATSQRNAFRPPSIRAPSIRAPSVRAPSVRHPSVRPPSVRPPSVRNVQQAVQPLYQQQQHAAPPPPPSPAIPIPGVPIDQPSTLFTKTDFPPLTTIPILRTYADWVPWESAAIRLIDNVGLGGHVCKIPEVGTLIDPTCPATYPPPYDFDSGDEETKAYVRWWHDDDIVTHILLGRLGPDIPGTLPQKRGPPHGLPVRTARHVLAELTKKFSIGSAGAADQAKEAIMKSRANLANIPGYVHTWRGVVNQLVHTPWDFTPYQRIQKFVDGLPSVGGFIGLKDRVRSSWNTGPEGTYTFEAISDEVIDIDINRHRNVSSSTPARPPAHRNVVTSTPTSGDTNPTTPLPSSTSSSLTPAAPPKPRVQCSNCGMYGHTHPECWAEGGGNVGGREAFRASRARANLASTDSSKDTEPLSPPLALIDDTDVDSEQVDTEVIEVQQFLYAAFSTESPPEDQPYLEFIQKSSPVILASIESHFNSVLDSACTTHIIRDAKHFWTYHPELAVPVGTANCGILQTKARGEVRFRAHVDGLSVVLVLADCLHAPDVPINLLSVGSMVENDIKLVFEKDATTIHFPDASKDLRGKSLSAMVHKRLSFLHCDFVPPPTPHVDTPLSFPAIASNTKATTFPRVEATPELWHRRFGHLGRDATRAVLTKNYATGVAYVGPFQDTHCIPCIIGKQPARPYDHFEKRADRVCDLLHMDTCGPFPVRFSNGQTTYFNSIIDDHSNFGSTALLSTKDQATDHFKSTSVRWELKSGNLVLVLRSDGALEFTAGALHTHLESRGIIHQSTAPYAHQQNGKAERYIRTIEDTAQTLMGESGLPLSFLGDAVLTSQYLRNLLPTSTLPALTTPFEVMEKRKPDLSQLRVWGCQCYVLYPAEIRAKGGPKRFEAIFVGYDENRIGWRVRDLNGKYFFSRDVIFNENVRGRLKPHNITPPSVSTPSPPPLDPSSPPSPPPPALSSSSTPLQVIPSPVAPPVLPSRPRRKITPTTLGRAHLEQVAAQNERLTRLRANRQARTLPVQGLSAILDFQALLTGNTFSDHDSSLEPAVLAEYKAYVTHGPDPLPFRTSREYDLTKAPENYYEATHRSDADVWLAAMKREVDGLHAQGVLQVASLPSGRKAIGVRWVYAFKLNPDGTVIRGKEKARLVAQGFSQGPDDYGNTYAPVAKLTSIRIILAYAALHDLDLFTFDVKTAFLHAPLSHEIFCKQIPGFPEVDKLSVYRVLRALYGLKQSSHEWYTLLRSVLEEIGLTRCEVDHAVFFGQFSSPPHPSIPMPTNGTDLVIIIPVHVDDGLTATNSHILYAWIIKRMNERFEVNDLGAASLYLGIRIDRDRSKRKLFLSQKGYVNDLLSTYHLRDARPSSLPLHQKLHSLPEPPPNSLPEIPDSEVKVHYQRLVGSLLYLSLCTCPDIAFTTMSLGQFNANPTRAHLLAAKGVLRYLVGTADYALEYNFLQTPVGPPMRLLLPGDCGMSDADWASDEVTRRSVSGYAFFLYSSLVSWSAVKQRTIALSSTEAEYMALTHAMKEAIWIRLLVTSLGLPIPRPFPLLCDNKSTLDIAKSDSTSSRSKHIDIRYHFIREHLLSDSFDASWVSTLDMTADILTKLLPLPLHRKFVAALGLIHMP